MSVIVKTVAGAVGASQSWQARIVALNAGGAVVPNEGIAIVQSDVSAIACSVYDLSSRTPTAPVTAPAITAAGAISNALVADEFWSENDQPIDAIGRNFLHTIPGSVFALADHLYRTVYSVTLGDGTPIIFAFDNLPQGLTP